MCSHKWPNTKCQRIRPRSVQKLSPTHISLLLPIPCQNPSASAWLCHLCLVMICCSVLREIGKQHEFTCKKWLFTFFPLIVFLLFVLLCTIITVLFDYIAPFLSLCADQACWKWKAACNLLNSLIVVLQVSWITDCGKFWSEVLSWSINWTTAGERTKAVSYLMFLETCSQFFMEDCCCSWIY